MSPVGFIGLGNMGGPMSANLAAAGHDLLVYDAAGTAERAPESARCAASVAEVAAEAEPVFLSLPDGPVVLAVSREIVAASPRASQTVVDLSTIGIDAAQEAAACLAEVGLDYVDSPVSGGVPGARRASLAVMTSGAPAVVERIASLLEPIGSNRFVVGTEPGQGQAMKLLNNYLSAIGTLATSEAVRFGERRGLDMKLMLDVLNASSGRNSATEEKFPTAVLPKTYDRGFTAKLMAKDVRLFRNAAHETGSPHRVADVVSTIWDAFAEAEPDRDSTWMYEFADQLPRE